MGALSKAVLGEWRERQIETKRLLAKLVKWSHQHYPNQDPKLAIAMGAGVSWRAIHEWMDGRVPRKNKFALLQHFAAQVTLRPSRKRAPTLIGPAG